MKNLNTLELKIIFGGANVSIRDCSKLTNITAAHQCYQQLLHQTYDLLDKSMKRTDRVLDLLKQTINQNDETLKLAANCTIQLLLQQNSCTCKRDLSTLFV